MSRTPTIKLRPSDAHRWLVCRASPGYLYQVADQLPEVLEDYIQEGIVAHELAAKWLNGEEAETADIEMDTHVKGYVDYVKKARKGADKFLVEQSVKVFYNPSRKGYIDAAILSFNKQGHIVRLHIVDLKYGRGVSVQAEENPQLASYARSLLEQGGYLISPKASISITIYQPRVVGEAAERTWNPTLIEFFDFTGKIDIAAREIQADPFNQPFAPSEDTCQFCPAQAICQKRALWLLGELDQTKEQVLAPTLLNTEQVVELPEPASLTTEQLGRLLKAADVFQKWLSKCESHVLALMTQRGEQVQGFKIVASTPHRRWDNEDKARTFLLKHLDRGTVVSESILTPSKAEGLLKKLKNEKLMKQFSQLVVRPEGQPVLASSDDTRPEFRDIDVNAEFLNEDEAML